MSVTGHIFMDISSLIFIYFSIHLIFHLFDYLKWCFAEFSLFNFLHLKYLNIKSIEKIVTIVFSKTCSYNPSSMSNCIINHKAKETKKRIFESPNLDFKAQEYSHYGNNQLSHLI